jgi:hypothetical protein
MYRCRGLSASNDIVFVMRGLDPRIHYVERKMDCRVKPGNDA